LTAVTEYLLKKFLGNGNLEDIEGGGKITVRWSLKKE
jgi:hypothetical protein